MTRRLHARLPRRVLGLGTVVALGVSALMTTTAFAGGNSNYLGIVAAASPTGYTLTPGYYDLSQQNPVQVTFSSVLSSKDGAAHTLNLYLSAHHILTFNGQDVSDGTPAIAFHNGDYRYTTQTRVTSVALAPVDVPATGSVTQQFTALISSCGYFQVDVGQSPSGTNPTLVGLFVRVQGCNQPPPPPGSQRYTPGYWKNHQAATTALLPITLGGYTVSTFSQVTAIFNAMKCSDAIDCLAAHLLAAKLDVANGSANCAASAISQADALLSSVGYSGAGTYNVSTSTRNQALALESQLDAYTNDATGNTC